MSAPIDCPCSRLDVEDPSPHVPGCPWADPEHGGGVLSCAIDTDPQTWGAAALAALLIAWRERRVHPHGSYGRAFYHAEIRRRLAGLRDLRARGWLDDPLPLRRHP